LLSTRALSWKILSEPYDFFVTRLGLNSTKRCSPGGPDYATAMGSGQNIGTTKWQDRHRSNPTNREKVLFPIVFEKFMSNAVNATKSFINIGFINLEATNPGMIDRFVFFSVLGFLVS
jgi:hypothetical protein